MKGCSQMNKFYRIFAATFILSIIMTGTLFAAPATDTRSISAVGVAGKEVMPDTAFINMAVETKAANANAAKAENSKVMDKLMKDLKKSGIDQKDIKTTGYSLSQDYKQNEKNKRVPSGYVLVHSLNVKVKDIDKAGAVIDTMQSAGANKFYGVDFTVSDQEKIERELLAKATKNGKEKAEIVAKAAGSNVGSLISARVGSVGAAMESGAGNRNMMRTFATADFVPETQITAGTITINVSVDVTFELK